MEVESKLKLILEDVLNEDNIDITNVDADLEKDYDMDSMDAVEITDRIEREFSVEIKTESIYSMKKVGDLLDVIRDLQKESN